MMPLILMVRMILSHTVDIGGSKGMIIMIGSGAIGSMKLSIPNIMVMLLQLHSLWLFVWLMVVL